MIGGNIYNANALGLINRNSRRMVSGPNFTGQRLWPLGRPSNGCRRFFIGGYLFSFMGISTYGTIGTIISSTAGAIILLWVIRMFSHDTPVERSSEIKVVLNLLIASSFFHFVTTI